MALSRTPLDPPEYALQSPRPDLLQAAGSYRLAAEGGLPVAPVLNDLDWNSRHASLIEMFESSEDSSYSNREKAERDIDYYDNKQWTDKEVKELQRRGQPAITKNRISRKINYLLGLERAQRTQPRAVPRTPQHETDAFAATAALRFVTDENRYNQVRSASFSDILRAGWGGYEITAKKTQRSQNPRIRVTRCQWDRMFWDPYSCADDFSDANYLGLVIWMDRTEAVKRYGAAAAEVFDETVSMGRIGGTFDDKPKETTWVAQGKRQRIRVVQMYFRDGDDWWFAEFTRGGYLNFGPSPWADEDGNSDHPYAWGSAYVDRDNNRYGVIREMIDTQDAINKRESKMLHLVSVRQTFGDEQLLSGRMTTSQLRSELAKPDGHLSLTRNVEWGKNFGIIPTNDMADGQFTLLQESKAEMDLMGPNAAMLGKGPQDQSGRAILAQQQGGEIELGTLTDTLRDMDHRCYRKVWNLIRQFWTGEEWVSVTDDARNMKWVGINTPQMQVDPMTGMEMPVVDPMTGQVTRQNDVSQLDVDITIDDAPALGTMAGENFAKMVDLARVVPTLQQLPASVWIKMSDLQNKAEILQELEQAMQPAPPDPMQQMAQQVALEQEQSKTALNKAGALDKVASAAQKFGTAFTPPMPPTQTLQ